MSAAAPVAVLLALLTASVGPRVVAAQQGTSGPDLSGTWVLDPARSDMAGAPVPKTDSVVITRAGDMYHIDQFADAGQGEQHVTSQWPVGDGQVTNEVPEQGAVVHSTVKVRGDTVTFTGDVVLHGQTVATQTGREFVSPDRQTMTRNIVMQPMTGGAAAPVHLTLVFKRK